MKTRKVLDLRPTQFAVGMLEVDEKIKAIGELGKKARKKMVKATPIPVIRGHDGHFYVVDRHHFLCVCYHTGITRVRVRVLRDFSKSEKRYSEFWTWMLRNRKSYPYCQFGEGPRPPLYLPKDVRGLADDPYRSLAWFVRKSGAFKNSEKNFAEFKWAKFFRKKKLLDRYGLQGMEKAMLRAVALAQSPEAKALPGYGKLKLSDRLDTDARVRRVARKVKKKIQAGGPARPSALKVDA